MSDDERQHWDERYATGDYAPRTDPSPFLVERLPLIPVGRALDVATGTGRHALHLAEAGFQVDAVDVSRVAVERARLSADERGLQVDWHVADLDADPLPGADYDLITVFRYRNEQLWPRLRDALAPDGWILVEHHLQTHLEVSGPSDPAFRLRPGELLTAFPGLRTVHYDERIEPSDDGTSRYVITRFAACAGDPGW